MFHVVEHFESPSDALRRAREWLRPDGRLLVEVPNAEAVCQWPQSRFHRAHLYNFSPATLEMAGRKAGYSVMSSSLSPDGGNITALFQKSVAPSPASAAIPGNFERVSAIVNGHTPLRHLFSPHPYARLIGKVASQIEERREARKAATPREILDNLIAKELRRQTK